MLLSDFVSSIAIHAFMQMHDILSFHEAKHNCILGRPVEISLSNDGVQECGSTSVSLNVFSVRIMGCQTVYPLAVVKVFPKESYDEDKLLEEIIEDLKYVHDNPHHVESLPCFLQ